MLPGILLDPFTGTGKGAMALVSVSFEKVLKRGTLEFLLHLTVALLFVGVTIAAALRL